MRRGTGRGRGRGRGRERPSGRGTRGGHSGTRGLHRGDLAAQALQERQRNFQIRIICGSNECAKVDMGGVFFIHYLYNQIV